MSGAHIVENTNTEKIRIFQEQLLPPPHNNEESLNNDLKDPTDRFKKLEDLEPLIEISCFIGSFFRKSSNNTHSDTQENSKDAQKKRGSA